MVAVGFLLIFSTLAVFGLRALDASTNRILEERLVLAEMAAGQIEGLVQQAFDELLQTAAFAPFDPAPPLSPPFPPRPRGGGGEPPAGPPRGGKTGRPPRGPFSPSGGAPAGFAPP